MKRTRRPAGQVQDRDRGTRARQLELKRETLRTLAAKDLSRVGGGNAKTSCTQPYSITEDS